MEKLKVRVNSLLDSNSAQKLLVSAGYRRKYNNFTLHNGWVCFDSDNNILCVCSSQVGKELDDYKEITLQELRDMVVLKRNDSKDTNYKNSHGDRYYVSSDLNIYIWQHEKWICHCIHGDIDRLSEMNRIKNTGGDISGLLKPIKEEVMRESLNDKIATAEVVRQEEKHSHYKKDVSHLSAIDPYRIADLYDLHPCADHIMKKSLCAGNRGHKDTLRDIQDIIDTAERWKQMIEEDDNEI